MSKLGAALAAAVIGWSAQFARAMDIVVNPSPELAANPQAAAAFNRAANAWGGRFTNNITLHIDGGWSATLDPGVIGHTSMPKYQAPYDFFRGFILSSAAKDSDDGIVASVPDLAHFTATLPTGFTFSGKFIATQANFKAVGYPENLPNFVPVDATISFNSSLAYDYDDSNGIDANKIDFQALAEHEIGHALGFISSVDTVDFFKSEGTTTDLVISPLDLFRFQDGVAGKDPASASDFANFPRYLNTGGNGIFDDTAMERAMSTGTYTGDLREAGHWKDDQLTGHLLGVMDPTMTYGQHETITAADIRALDLIGYDVVPEASGVALGMLVVPLMRRRSLRRV
jgi:hypothetical protein